MCSRYDDVLLTSCLNASLPDFVLASFRLNGREKQAFPLRKLFRMKNALVIRMYFNKAQVAWLSHAVPCNVVVEVVCGVPTPASIVDPHGSAGLESISARIRSKLHTCIVNMVGW